MYLNDRFDAVAAVIAAAAAAYDDNNDENSEIMKTFIKHRYEYTITGHHNDAAMILTMRTFERRHITVKSPHFARLPPCERVSSHWQ